jgi:deoxycytidylate deaminase
MLFSSFIEMQKAVDIVGSSPHPTNKISATIFGTAQDGTPFSISKTNFWPQSIVEKIGQGVEIGNSSGTIHAETAAIFAAPYTNGASVAVTDPPCPNCAKNMAEAGIKTVYIDHKGFDKDFAERRGEQFTSMSMRIFKRAGMNIFEIQRKSEKLTPILETPASFTPHEDNPIEIENCGADDFKKLIGKKTAQYVDTNFAFCLARDAGGNVKAITARAHPTIGYNYDVDRDSILRPDGKYSFVLEPVNRLLMNAPRHGLTILDGALFSAQTPTAREQVNMIGAGLQEITVGNFTHARDDSALAARDFLQEKGAFTFNAL